MTSAAVDLIALRERLKIYRFYTQQAKAIFEPSILQQAIFKEPSFCEPMKKRFFTRCRRMNNELQGTVDGTPRKTQDDFFYGCPIGRVTGHVNDSVRHQQALSRSATSPAIDDLSLEPRKRVSDMVGSCRAVPWNGKAAVAAHARNL